MTFITSLPPLTMQITDGSVVFNLLLHLHMVRHSRYLGLWTTACLVPCREASTRAMLRYRLCQKQSNKQSLTRYFLESFAIAGKCSSIIKSTTFLHKKKKKEKKKKLHNWYGRKARPTKTETAVHGCHIARVTVVLKNTVTNSSLH